MKNGQIKHLDSKEHCNRKIYSNDILNFSEIILKLFFSHNITSPINFHIYFFPFSSMSSLFSLVYFSVIPLQLLHKMSDQEQHGFQRCSPSFWRSSDDSSSCLNSSSITVTPVNSPDSRLSLGLLIPPPSKCGLPKPISENSIPRPHVIC